MSDQNPAVSTSNVEHTPGVASPSTGRRNVPRKVVFALVVVVAGILYIAANHYQRFTTQMNDSGSSSTVSSTKYVTTTQSTLSFHGVLGVEVTNLRSVVVAAVPVKVGPLTLCPHYNSSTFTCAGHATPVMIGAAFRPFTMSTNKTISVVQAFTLVCTAAQAHNPEVTMGVFVTFRYWWFTHSVLLISNQPGFASPDFCPQPVS
jgi:hypothetical protein